jgi:hypothetical protein
MFYLTHQDQYQFKVAQVAYSLLVSSITSDRLAWLLIKIPLTSQPQENTSIQSKTKVTYLALVLLSFKSIQMLIDLLDQRHYDVQLTIHENYSFEVKYDYDYDPRSYDVKYNVNFDRFWF